MNATVIYVGVRALKSFVSYNRTIFHKYSSFHKSCAPSCSWPSHHSLVPIEHLKCIGTRYNAARRPLRLPVVFTQSPTPRLLPPMPLQTHPPSTSVSVAYRHTSSSGWWQRPTPRPRRRTVSLGPETIVCPRSWQRWLLSAALSHFLLLFIAHTAWLGLTQHKAPQRELVTTRSHLFCRPCSLCGGTRELKLPHWRTFPYKSSRHGVVLEILRAHARVHRTQLRGESPSAGTGVGLDILCHSRG